MAKAEIKMSQIEPRSNYFICTIEYKVKAGFSVLDNSLRVYYSTTPSITSSTPYVAVNNSSGAILSLAMNSNGWRLVRVKIPVDASLSADTTYWLRARLEIYKTNGAVGAAESYKKYRSPKNPTPVTTADDSKVRKLFQIATYSNPHEGEDGETDYDQTWTDFTDKVTLGSYDVNYEDTEEDWTDADYVTHRIVPRSKIKGSLELLFSTKYDYNKFLQLIKMNRIVNGNGYTQLKVHVNNDIDIYEEDLFNSDSQLDLENRPCVSHIGNFFVKMENNPFNNPVFGYYDKYEPLRLEIEEA